MEIETTNYMSTNDFVHENKLQEKAEELFGKDWVAEDDVEQIEKLLDKVAPNKYIVTCYGAMFSSDYDIEVREIDGLTTKEDIMEFCDDLATQITKDIHGDAKTCTGNMPEESLKSYHNIYGVIEDYIDKNYILNFVRK